MKEKIRHHYFFDEKYHDAFRLCLSVPKRFQENQAAGDLGWCRLSCGSRGTEGGGRGSPRGGRQGKKAGALDEKEPTSGICEMVVTLTGGWALPLARRLGGASPSDNLTRSRAPSPYKEAVV